MQHCVYGEACPNGIFCLVLKSYLLFTQTLKDLISVIIDYHPLPQPSA